MFEEWVCYEEWKKRNLSIVIGQKLACVPDININHCAMNVNLIISSSWCITLKPLNEIVE